MDDITGHFVTECLLKGQTFFESMCGEKSAGWMDKIYKKTLMEYSVSIQIKRTLSKVSACCRCSLPS